MNLVQVDSTDSYQEYDLLKKYLPSWAVLEYGDALAAAQKRVRELEAENRTLRAYINGVERGLRAKQPEIRIERSDGG